MENLVAYAKKVEGDMYESANSRVGCMLYIHLNANLYNRDVPVCGQGRCLTCRTLQGDYPHKTWTSCTAPTAVGNGWMKLPCTCGISFWQ